MKNKIVTIIILVLMGLVIFTSAASAQIFYFNSKSNFSPNIESNNFNNTQENVVHQESNNTQQLNNIFYFFTKNYNNKTPQQPIQPIQPVQPEQPVQPTPSPVQPVQPEQPVKPVQPEQPIINETNSIVNSEELKMLEHINQERAKAGIAPLQMDTEIARVAQIKSQDMVDHNYFSHTSPTYGSPFDMMKNFGITYRAAGENIARNSTMFKAHIALMNSEGHRNNILNPNYTHIGIGIVKNQTSSGITVTQMFIKK